jgi:hypothetical protein
LVILKKKTVIFGICVFLVFNYLQYKHKRILGALNKYAMEHKDIKLETFFKPKGMLFKYITCPVEFCEFMIYFSFLIICGGLHGYL